MEKGDAAKQVTGYLKHSGFPSPSLYSPSVVSDTFKIEGVLLAKPPGNSWSSANVKSLRNG